jgi:hypothetical protein
MRQVCAAALGLSLMAGRGGAGRAVTFEEARGSPPRSRPRGSGTRRARSRRRFWRATRTMPRPGWSWRASAGPGATRTARSKPRAGPTQRRHRRRALCGGGGAGGGELRAGPGAAGAVLAAARRAGGPDRGAAGGRRSATSGRCGADALVLVAGLQRGAVVEREQRQPGRDDRDRGPALRAERGRAGALGARGHADGVGALPVRGVRRPARAGQLGAAVQRVRCRTMRQGAGAGCRCGGLRLRGGGAWLCRRWIALVARTCAADRERSRAEPVRRRAAQQLRAGGPDHAMGGGARSLASVSASVERQVRFDRDDRSAWVTRLDARRIWQVNDRGDVFGIGGGLRRAQSDSIEIDNDAVLFSVDYTWNEPVLGPATLGLGLNLEYRDYDESPFTVDGRQDRGRRFGRRWARRLELLRLRADGDLRGLAHRVQREPLRRRGLRRALRDHVGLLRGGLRTALPA